jgi:hypothetical protein
LAPFIKSAFLFGILTARTNGSNQYRPAAIVTIAHRLSQHATNQRAAAPSAAGAGADAGAFAYLLKRLGAGLDSFDHGAFADLVTDASGLEILDNRLLSGFLF